MKIGINRWTLPDELTLAECFAHVRSAGFDSIEVNIAENGEITPSTSEADIRNLVTQAKDAGIEISSLSSGLGWQYPLTSSDEEARRKGIETVRGALQAAHWLGVDTILLVPGIVNADIAYDDAYRRAQEALRELAPDAQRLGVSIGVENVWNKFLLSPLEFARFLDEIDSPFVGAYFDVGNVLVYGYPDQWIRILGGRIKKVHVKDFQTGIGNISGFCNPLQGNVPWDKVNEALNEIGYDSHITAEVNGYNTRFEVGLRHIAESLKAIFTPGNLSSSESKR